MVLIATASSETRTRRRYDRAFRRSLMPRASSASTLRVALTRYLSDHRIDDSAKPKIVLCADEAFINAVQHAPDSPVSVAAQVHDDRLVMEVTDEGPGFDPDRLVDEPIPDLMGEHGRGLFLIRQLMDDCEILSDGRGTTLRMVIGLGAASGTAKDADDGRGVKI